MGYLKYFTAPSDWLHFFLEVLMAKSKYILVSIVLVRNKLWNSLIRKHFKVNATLQLFLTSCKTKLRDITRRLNTISQVINSNNIKNKLT